ncbi:MAG: hypothetical protein EAZ47_09455, partial [Bacteroidetes bacterium]
GFKKKYDGNVNNLPNASEGVTVTGTRKKGLPPPPPAGANATPPRPITMGDIASSNKEAPNTGGNNGGGNGGGGMQTVYTEGALTQGGQGGGNEPASKAEYAKKGGTTCSKCVNPETIGLSYPGGNNPRSFDRNYSYSYFPTDLSEFPAIGHDRRYDNLRITGASGLLLNTKSIGADWRFVYEELSIAINPQLRSKDRLHAGLLGIGLGLCSLPKTLFQLHVPFGKNANIMKWYEISNTGVTNKPDIHKH